MISVIYSFIDVIYSPYLWHKSKIIVGEVFKWLSAVNKKGYLYSIVSGHHFFLERLKVELHMSISVASSCKSMDMDTGVDRCSFSPYIPLVCYDADTDPDRSNSALNPKYYC